MRILHLLTASFVSTLIPTIALAGGEASPECSDMEKGDKAACTARAKAECTSKDLWTRRDCETAIVMQLDVCRAKKDEIEKTCGEPADELEAICGVSFQQVRQGQTSEEKFIEAAKNIDSAVKKHAAIVRDYGECRACASQISKKACPADSAKQLKEGYVEAVDLFLAKWKDQIDGIAERQLEYFGNLYKKEATEWIEFNQKLPAAFRVDEKPLRTIIATGEKNIARHEKIELDRIAARGCPKGQKASSKFVSMMKQRMPGLVKKAKIIRQGELIKDRDGLISTESVMLMMCYKDDDGKCFVGTGGVRREKPPGGSWTSWETSVGGDEQINCAKMK